MVMVYDTYRMLRLDGKEVKLRDARLLSDRSIRLMLVSRLKLRMLVIWLT